MVNHYTAYLLQNQQLQELLLAITKRINTFFHKAPLYYIYIQGLWEYLGTHEPEALIH